MNGTYRKIGSGRAARAAAGVALAAAAVAAAAGCPAKPTPAPPKAPPPTAPADPATRPATGPAVSSYLDVVRSAYPSVAAKPLAVPVTLSEAARIRLDCPVHLDGQGHLWITHDGGTPIDAALADAGGPEAKPSKPNPTKDAAAAAKEVSGNEHVVRDRVRCVAWLMDRQNDPRPHAVVDAPAADRAAGGPRYQLVSVAAGRRAIGNRSDYRWDEARTWEDGDARRLIVPTAAGFSVFTIPVPRGDVAEAHQELSAAAGTQPRFSYAPKGIVAWVPDAGGGAARYVNGAWTKLGGDAGFPDVITHVIPYPNGAVTVISPNPAGGLRLSPAALEPTAASSTELAAVADALADPSTRDRAVKQLNDFGPGAWPAVARLTSLTPEEKAAVDEAVDERVAALMGMWIDAGGKAMIAARLRDGGVLLHAPNGAAKADGRDGSVVGPRVTPAWVVLRPGVDTEIRLGPLVAEAVPGKSTIDVIGDRWVLNSDGFGPRLFLHNAFRRLLKKDERAFTTVVGVDRRGRWLFRQPGPPPADGSPGVTLIVDPTLPSLEPRLPVWVIQYGEEFGWDKDGWPVVRTGGTQRMRVTAAGYQGMKPEEKLLIDVSAAPIPTAATRPADTDPAGTRPAATRPATKPTSGPSPARLAEFGRPLLIDADGTRYFGGVDNLTILRPDGSDTTWTLPSEAQGFSPPAFLARAGDGRLYLVNQPGRVLRLKATPGADEPLAVEQAFTKGLPADDAPLRVWTDPAGRLVILLDRKLVILFPEGYIPRPVRDLMAGGDDDGVTPVEPDGEVL